jgi:hypothetical protein
MMMATLATRGLLIAATLLSGLLAGFNLDRAVVHNAAWHRLGATAWAAYSLHADLDIRAAMFYPFLGIGVALLSAAAAISFRRNRNEPGSAAMPILAGALFAISGLLMTFFAAPHMLSVPRVVDDPVGLKRALDGFVFWGDIRSVLQFLAFAANLWSLKAILEPPRSREAKQGRLR